MIKRIIFIVLGSLMFCITAINACDVCVSSAFFNAKLIIMNKIYFSIILFSVTLITLSCGKDDDATSTTDYSYHAHIHSPNTDDKHVGDSIHVEVNFESHTGEAVHHVNVRIYNKADNTEVYNKPDEAHVHQTDGKFEFEDDFILSNSNGVTEHTNWVMEAKVWGAKAGEGEVTETVEFHVHP